MPHDSHAAELAHHEALYSGFAQKHFAKAAVRELRRHLVRRILEATGAGKSSRVVSLGCGIGDTQLLLAEHVGFVAGFDLSHAAIRQELKPRETAARFAAAGFQARSRWHDFASTPLTGLLPSWSSGYRAARLLDEALFAFR